MEVNLVRHGIQVNSSSSVPQWLQVLLGEKFFMPCLAHVSQKKNEKNVLCLDCYISLCPHCLLRHRSHRLLQIRRYVYQDVLRLGEAQKLMDCSFVQPYTTNRAKVVFLKQRPRTRQFKGSGHTCVACDRNLQDRFFFCSISCKVHHMVKAKFGPTPAKHCELKWGRGLKTCLDLGGIQMTPDSVLEMPHSLQTSSGSSTNSISGSANSSVKALACTATTEFVKKKRTTISVSRLQHRSIRLTAANFSKNSSRRKRAPRRSPLY